MNSPTFVRVIHALAIGNDAMDEDMTTSYALRHRTTGRFVRLEVVPNGDADNCTASTCRLRTDDADLPRFEVETLRDLMAAMRMDAKWYDSTPRRPMHGIVRMEDCVAFRLDVSETYDDLGGDPVEVSTSARRVELPPILHGRPKTLGRPGPKDSRGAFDPDAWNEILEERMDVVAMDASSSGTPLPGMLVLTDRNNLLQVAHVVEDPEGPAGRLLVACTNDEIREMSPEAFADREEVEVGGFGI